MKTLLKKIAPQALVIGLAIVIAVILYSEFGAIDPVVAQVNLGRIGETITETVGEAAAETAGEYAQAEEEIETPSAEEPQAVEPEVVEPVDVSPAETESEMTEEEAEAFVAQFYTSTEGVAGTKFTDLTEEEMRVCLDQIIMLVAGVSEPTYVDALMPIFQRFQIMVSPPVEKIDDWALPPWESGERRYSPFDAPGLGGGTGGLSLEPIPPFTSTDPYGDVATKPEEAITAAMVASVTLLKGIVADGENFIAFIFFNNEERRVKVGDVLGSLGEKTFIIADINLNSVRIEVEGDPNDAGLIQFGTRTQIQDFSISY